jgi:hypothetical protein
MGRIPGFEQARRPANLDPGQLAPVLAVAVDNQTHGRVDSNVDDTTKTGRVDALGLFVDWREDVTMNDREADGNDVRLAFRVRGRQPANARREQELILCARCSSDSGVAVQAISTLARPKARSVPSGVNSGSV